MPKNNRVAKEYKKYSLRLDPVEYDKVQQIAENKGIPMNALLQQIICDFTKEETLTKKEEIVFDKIKSLPLEEQKAKLKKLSIDD